MASQVERQKLIIKILCENPGLRQSTVARRAKVSQATVSNVLKRLNTDVSFTRKVGSGRKKGYMSPQLAKKVVALLEKNPCLSNRKVAQKVTCSESLVRKIKSEAGLKSYKVQSVPDRNATKNLDAQNRAAKLKADFFQKCDCCVMDDETYVYARFSQLPGQEFYTAKERGGVDEKFRTKQRSKFPKKYLVWQAICSCGLRSDVFITQGTINSQVYVKECLQRRLLPFLRKHNVSTFFWPDLASCHYSKLSIEWFEQNLVKLVPREANPPNCPELRPIERYWALIKRELKETKKEAKDIADFKTKWNTAAKKIPETTVKALMEGVPEKLSKFCRKTK